MNKNYTTIIVLLIISTIIWGMSYYFVVKYSPKSTDDLLLEEVQKIELKLDSLSNKKDSIKTVILTTDKEILKNEKHYEKVVDYIISQPSNADSIFARDYIQKFIDERIR